MMKEPKAEIEERKGEITIFYCTHQREQVERILKGFDGAGRLRVRRVGLPCSGKLEIFQLTKALEGGADGVALFGCPEPECRYVVGSTRAKGRVSHTGKILEGIGLEKERVRRFVLGSQPPKETLEDLSTWVEKVKAMGSIPSGAKGSSVP